MGGAPDVLAALRVETSRGAHRPPPTGTATATTTTILDETSDNARAKPTEKEEKSRRFATAQSATTSTLTTTSTTSNRFPTTPRPPRDYRKPVSRCSPRLLFLLFFFLYSTRSTKITSSGPELRLCRRYTGCSTRVRSINAFVFTTARMFKEALSKSGRRILKAIKKLSTRSRVVRKSQQISHYEMSPARTNNWSPSYPDPDSVSLSWSIPSLDTKSVDTYLTYVTEGMDECSSMCCYCREHDENQRNENRENEMII